jgi:hypothetical protein
VSSVASGCPASAARASLLLSAYCTVARACERERRGDHVVLRGTSSNNACTTHSWHSRTHSSLVTLPCMRASRHCDAREDVDARATDDGAIDA